MIPRHSAGNTDMVRILQALTAYGRLKSAMDGTCASSVTIDSKMLRVCIIRR